MQLTRTSVFNVASIPDIRFSRLELRPFMLACVRQFFDSKIDIYLANEVSPAGSDYFTHGRLAAFFGWDVDATRRLCNAATEAGCCTKINHDKYKRSLIEHRVVPNPSWLVKQSEWLASAAPGSSEYLGLIDLVNSHIDHAGGLVAFRESDSSLFDLFSEAVAIQFYRHVVAQALNPDIINAGLMRGAGVADLCFSLPTSKQFDHYDVATNVLTLHALSFALSNLSGNTELVEKLEVKNSDSLLDVGGGAGQFASVCLSRSPDISVTVLDHPSSAKSLETVRKSICGKELSKIHWVYEDFLISSDVLLAIKPEEKFDRIFLGWILHDWTDEICVQILTKCSAHLKPGGLITVLEKPLDEQRIDGATYDFSMMLMASGKERTVTEYDAIASRAGIRRVNWKPSDQGRHALEYRRKL